MKLVFATNNAHKLEEIKEMLGSQHEIVSLKEIQCHEDIPEEQDTLEGNALQKARYIHEKYGLDCFADDTGLEIKALNNAPGVYSARYAGNAHDSEANMKKVLQEMQNISERQARFRTVIALILGEKEYLFEGIVNGEILTSKHGHEGFGLRSDFPSRRFSRKLCRNAPSREKRNQPPGPSSPGIMQFFKQLIKKHAHGEGHHIKKHTSFRTATNSTCLFGRKRLYANDYPVSPVQA